MENPAVNTAASSEPTTIDLYASEGSRKCAALARVLRRRGIDVDVHDINENSDAAARVRREHGDAEPVVAVGGLSFVDPTPDSIEVLVRRFAPDRVHRRSIGSALRSPWRR